MEEIPGDPDRVRGLHLLPERTIAAVFRGWNRWIASCTTLKAFKAFLPFICTAPEVRTERSREGESFFRAKDSTGNLSVRE